MDYQETIESIAMGVIESVIRYDAYLCDAVHESVDGSEIVIYTHQARAFNEWTSYDGEDLASDCYGDVPPHCVIRPEIAAFFALEAEVYEYVREHALEIVARAIEGATVVDGEIVLHASDQGVIDLDRICEELDLDMDDLVSEVAQ